MIAIFKFAFRHLHCSTHILLDLLCLSPKIYFGVPSHSEGDLR